MNKLNTPHDIVGITINKQVYKVMKFEGETYQTVINRTKEFYNIK